MKFIRLFVVLLLIILLLSIPIHAGFWDIFKVSKVSTKQVEKKTIKQEEKQTIKQGEKQIDDISTQTDKSLKEGKRTLDDLVNEEYRKKYGTIKYSYNQERMLKNSLKGEIWQDLVKKTLCKNTKCYTDYFEARANIVWWQRNPSHFIISDDSTAGIFIKNFVDSSFNRKPDFVEVFRAENSEKIIKIKLIEAKTSKEAVRSSQDYAYKQVCAKAKFECEFEYAMPKSSSPIECLVVGMIIGGPDPTDLLCFVSP